MMIHLNNVNGVLLVGRDESECDSCFDVRLGEILESINPYCCFNC
jgi:hypothetical protein